MSLIVSTCCCAGTWLSQHVICDGEGECMCDCRQKTHSSCELSESVRTILKRQVLNACVKIKSCASSTDVLWELQISVPTATDTVLFIFRYHPEALSAECLRLGKVVCIQYRRIVDAADIIANRG